MKYTIQKNQPGLFETDDEDEAYAYVKKLGEDDPGVTYDVLERIAQSVAPMPEKPVVVADVISTKTGEKINVKQMAIGAVDVLITSK